MICCYYAFCTRTAHRVWIFMFQPAITRAESFVSHLLLFCRCRFAFAPLLYSSRVCRSSTPLTSTRYVSNGTRNRAFPFLLIFVIFLYLFSADFFNTADDYPTKLLLWLWRHRRLVHGDSCDWFKSTTLFDEFAVAVPTQACGMLSGLLALLLLQWCHRCCYCTHFLHLHF